MFAMFGDLLSKKRFGKLALMVATGLCLNSTGQFAMANSIAYVGTGSGAFGTMDLNTGVFSLLGNSNQLLAGMAVANGTLYATDYHQSNGKLYSVNTTNGSLSLIGASTVVYDDAGSTTNGGLYAVGLDSILYSIDPLTGAATSIGSTGLSLGTWRSLSTNSSTLYFANGSNLYTLDTSTGAATLVGNMGGPMVGAMVFEDGILWGGQESPTLAVATLDTATGLATTGAAMTGPGYGNWWAIAPYPVPTSTSVPEPATISLLALCLVGMGFAVRRKIN